MFNFIVILDSAPYFFLAQDKKQVLEVLKTYKTHVIKVVKGTDLKVQDVFEQVLFEDSQTLLIPEIVEDLEEEIEKEFKEDLTEELTID